MLRLPEAMYEAMKAYKQGKMIIVVDDYHRENEGDLVIAGEFATPAAITFMARFGKGLICVAIDQSYAERLKLEYMVRNNRDPHHTAFTISVDAHPRHGITTGISAFERAKTVEVLLNPDSRPEDLSGPGHMFPLIAKPNGVFERRGHTEASTDLCRMCGLKPAAVIVEIMKNDGNMARLPDLRKMARRWNMPIVSVEDICNARSMLEAEREPRLVLERTGAL